MMPKTASLLGAVYDGDIRFDGRVFIRPNGPAATACPIFSNGDNFNVSVVRNSANVPFQLSVLVPQNHPLGTYNCTLTYSATQTNPSTGEVVPIASKGNQVGFNTRSRTGLFSDAAMMQAGTEHPCLRRTGVVQPPTHELKIRSRSFTSWP